MATGVVTLADLLRGSYGHPSMPPGMSMNPPVGMPRRRPQMAGSMMPLAPRPLGLTAVTGSRGPRIGF